MSTGALPIDEEEEAALAAEVPESEVPPPEATAEDLPASDGSDMPVPAAVPGSDLMEPAADVLSAPPVPGPAPVGPDPAAMVGKGGSTIRRPIIDAEEAAATARIPENARAKIAANEQSGAVEVGKANDNVAAIERQAQIEKDFQARRAQAAAAHEKLIADINAKYDAQVAANDGAKMHDYFSSERGGNRVLAAIMGALGGFNQSYNGGRNIGAEMVQKKVDEDYRLQRDEIERGFRKEVRLRGDVATATKNRDKALLDNDLMKVSALKAAGLEAAAQTARRGAPAAQANTNAITAGLNEAADKLLLETKQKQHAFITNTYKAGKGTGGGGAGGRISELVQMKIEGYDAAEIQRRAEELHIKPKEYRPLIADVRTDEAAAAKRLGKSKGPKDETIVRDEHKNPIGFIPSGRGGVVKFANEDANYTAAIKKLERIQKDIEENGERVYGPDAVKRRETMYDDAGIAVGIVSPLGKTDSALQHEFGTLGKSGAYTTQGANLEAIKRKIEEVKANQDRYRNQTLTPITPEELSDINARGKGGGAAPEAKPAAPKSSGSPVRPEKNDLLRARLIHLRDDPNKPQDIRDKAKAQLKAMGQ